MKKDWNVVNKMVEDVVLSLDVGCYLGDGLSSCLMCYENIEKGEWEKMLEVLSKDSRLNEKDREEVIGLGRKIWREEKKESIYGEIMEKWENLWVDVVLEWEDGLWGDEKEDCIEWFKKVGVDLIMVRRKLKDVYYGMEVDDKGCVNFKIDGKYGKYDDELKRIWNDFVENIRIEIEEICGDKWNKYYANMKV